MSSSTQSDSWASVSEYKDRRITRTGPSRRRTGKESQPRRDRSVKLLPLGLILMLSVAIIVVCTFLWQGTWIIPFLQ